MVAKIEHNTRTGCPIACSLDIVGDHWSLLIVRNLLFLGVHEYKDMLEKEERISSSILTNRLKKLESDGLISSTAHPDSQKRKLYFLTESGKGLIHMMVELVLWANSYLSDVVDIPEHKKVLLETDPEKFKELVLSDLADWENTYLQKN